MIASEIGERTHDFFRGLQDEITSALERIDGQAIFRVDEWTHAERGGGRSCVLEEGAVIEKGGVNLSCVGGEMGEAFAKELPGRGRHFFATGISLIIHPRSPHAPTVHANFRYLEKGDGDEKEAWFGGGADLTPWILYQEDAVHFHQAFKAACDRHPIVAYGPLKRWCDEYFFLPHRGETRGIGGIFFDYLGVSDAARQEHAARLANAFCPQPALGPRTLHAQLEAFVRDTGKSFLAAYLPILEHRKNIQSTPEERDWQLHRRGRYVEFNLLYDRGTIFGLKTGGRVESILVSLPNLVRWSYGHTPALGSREAELIDVLKSPRDWLST